MHILIIDDNVAKTIAVTEVINTSAKAVRKTISITTAAALSDAVALISSTAFDIIVLDLMLPYISDGAPDHKAGLEALRLIRHDACINRHATVVGLSAFPAEAISVREKFDSYGAIIQRYDEVAVEWKNALSFQIVTIASRPNAKLKIDFIIFTALEKEKVGFESAGAILGNRSTISGLNVQEIAFVGAETYKGIIIRLRDMGLIASTYEVTTALNVFDPICVCMSGICAGFSDHVKLGQVVIGSPIWEYQAGKWSNNGFEIAPKQVSIPASSRVVIEQAVEDVEWWSRVEEDLPDGCVRPPIKNKPKVLPSASGSAVIADIKKLAHIEAQHRKVAAIEMEAYGLYYSISENQNNIRHFFSAKSVVDFADDSKDDNIHQYGCILSARVSKHLLLKLLERP
ncbi:hypothetical protein [Methylorubrum extorquens]